MQHNSKISTKDLGGDQRYLMYVSTDKPIYRGSEVLYATVVILNALDNTPYSGATETVSVSIRGPKGDIVFQANADAQDSSVGFKWEIPAESAGGEYTVMVNSQVLGTPEVQRLFDIRAYRAPRLKTQIEFMREGYGPGDLVTATVKVERAEGGIPTGAKVTVVARVDGAEVFNRSGYVVAQDGTCSAEFHLPQRIDVGDGSLSFIVEDGGVVDTAVKTIPILLQTLEIKFYPEGGDLISGLEGRIYMQANRPDGKPADIEGRIVELIDGKPGDAVLSRVKTAHEGRGVFTLLPESKVTSYILLIDSPSGINRHFPLPEQKPNGSVLKSLKNVYAYAEKISFSMASSGSNPAALLTLHKREVLIDSVKVNKPEIKGQSRQVELDSKDHEGVLIATVWDSAGNPLAERLIYRQPRFAVHVDIRVTGADEDMTFVPGAELALEIRTTDEKGSPVEAVVGIRVTDDAVLEMIEKREQAPRLPVMVYLENEVSDLADAHIYLDAQNIQAPEAVDLLLGTQGWRRFVLCRYAQIKQHHPGDAQRILAEKKQPSRMAGFALRGGDPFGEGLDPFQIPEDWNDAVIECVVDAVPPFMPDDIEPLRMLGPNNQVAADPFIPDNIAKEEVAFAMKPNKIMAMEQDIPPPFGNKAKRDARIMIPAPRAPTIFIREFAYQVRANRKPNDRIDFAETLFWHAGLRTSARDGKASVKFSLSDSVTAFRVRSDAFARNGALGSTDFILHSVEPFYIEAKMPLDATVGDIIELPVALVNAGKTEISSANLLVRGEGLNITQVTPIALAAGERARRIVRIGVDKPGVFSLKISAAAGEYTDTVTRSLTVKPRGFPLAINHGGLIGAEINFTQQIIIPTDIEPSSLHSHIKIYPSPLASMEEALNALLQQPSGCFEQTSSTNYPLVMAQQYFVSHQGVSLEKISQAKELLNAGYKKLTGFESKDKGYEWFGASPAHEALTAYGLMEFVDMAKVMSVDESMIKRTRDWLLQQRDGAGGFKRNERALDSFGQAPPQTTSAYIIWSLLESGEDAAQLQKEIAAIKVEALKTNDTYVIALAANILYLAGDKPSARELAQKLAKAADNEGAISGAVTSITRSGGDALAIETTSLALLAWLKEDAHWAAQIEVSMKWLFERSKAGRFGSTQSTVLALKAINVYDAARAQPKQAGTVQLFINDKPFGAAVGFEKETKGAIELPDFSAAMTPGKHIVALKMTGGSKMPFALDVLFNTRLPVTSDNTELKLETKLSGTKINEGEPVEMQVILTVAKNDAPTPVVILGIPAGLEVRHDQLKELVSANRISAYEVRGSEVILYWRALKAQEKRIIPVSFTAAIPGTYTAAASRAYLYYTDENKFWEKGQAVIVNARP